MRHNALARERLPDRVQPHNLGSDRLKDLTRPEQISQVVAPDLPSDFPPLATLDRRHTNLPAQRNPLIGREYETVTLKYSMVRTNPNPTYKPLILAEKDPIRRKYGPIVYAGINRDTDTGLLAQQEYVVRFDPAKR